MRYCRLIDQNGRIGRQSRRGVDFVVTIRSRGGVAKWLCSGLQSRLRRFDPDPRLQYSKKSAVCAFFTCAADFGAQHARVVKLVDTADLKSAAYPRGGVPVRFRSRAPHTASFHLICHRTRMPHGLAGFLFRISVMSLVIFRNTNGGRQSHHMSKPAPGRFLVADRLFNECRFPVSLSLQLKIEYRGRACSTVSGF